jgi:hypothetical protein
MLACSGNCVSNSTIKPFAASAIQHKTKHDKRQKIKKDHLSTWFYKFDI